MLKPVALLAALGLAASPLAAQDLVALCKQMSHPAVGAWSSYRIQGGSNDGATVKISVVGTESHGDTAYLWIEMAMNGFEGARGEKFSGISKMLVTDFGPGFHHHRAWILKIGTAPAMAMPQGGPMSQMTGGDEAGFEKCAEGQSLGWENVTVPGGTFHALHIKDKTEKESDVWVVPSLALGLIKASKVNGSGDLVMTGHGSGAKSAITETPVPFNPALMMQMMGGQTSH